MSEENTENIIILYLLYIILNDDIIREDNLTDALTLLSLQVTLLAIQSSWAPLAGMAPTLANCRAAQLPRAKHVRKTRQALFVSHFGVTRPGSGTQQLCNAKQLERLRKCTFLT